MRNLNTPGGTAGNSNTQVPSQAMPCKLIAVPATAISIRLVI
jgi:hypothetical protein